MYEWIDIRMDRYSNGQIFEWIDIRMNRYSNVYFNIIKKGNIITLNIYREKKLQKVFKTHSLIMLIKLR